MLLYLSVQSQYDIAYPFNFSGSYIFIPKHLQNLASKRISLYLKATRDRGLVLNYSPELKIDFYPDFYFAIIYGHEDSTDQLCVNRKTGYAIIVADFPVLWNFELQT